MKGSSPQIELQGRARVERQPGGRVAEDLAEHSNLALGGGAWGDELGRELSYQRALSLFSGSNSLLL